MKPLDTYFSETRSVTKTEALVATDYGKVIDQRDSNPCEQRKAQTRRPSQKAVGSNSGVIKGCFLPNSLCQCSCKNILLGNL